MSHFQALSYHWFFLAGTRVTHGISSVYRLSRSTLLPITAFYASSSDSASTPMSSQHICFYFQTPPSLTLSTLTNLDSMDLATSIIGKQVHKQSKTVQWSDGSTTVLPCIMKDSINILQDDADAVALFVSLPESKPETSKYVVHLQYSNWTNKNCQLCNEISTALWSNKAVLICKVTTPKPKTLDLDYLRDCSMSDLMCVIVHGEPIQNFNFLIFF
jgi:hypothetical protein